NWSDWLTRHGPALLLLARQFVPSQADAEDALHDGFVRFWRRRDRIEDAHAYLFTCVRAAALDRVKSEPRPKDRDEQYPVRFFSMPDSAEQREQEKLIANALAQLPAAQREVVVMKLWGGLQFDQIGQAVGININTAASRYRYAIAKLRTLLSEELVKQ